MRPTDGVRVVTAYTFPAEVFVVEGDPEAVRESGRSYGRFAASAAKTAAGLRGLDSGAWVGSEGDLFRAQLAEIPPHLDTASGPNWPRSHPTWTPPAPPSGRSPARSTASRKCSPAPSARWPGCAPTPSRPSGR
jgi:hypothetical protein